MAEHPAVALLENLVHLELDPEDVPETYKLIEVEFPDDVVVGGIDVALLDQELETWRSNIAFTRSIGDDWLARAESPILIVPSVILPHSQNALFNPLHPDAGRATVVSVTQPAYDRRLFHGLVSGV